MDCEDLMAYCTSKWLSDILLRNYDSVCAMTLALLLVLVEWRKILDLLYRLRTLYRFFVADAMEISSRDLSVTCGHRFLNGCGNVKA